MVNAHTLAANFKAQVELKCGFSDFLLEFLTEHSFTCLYAADVAYKVQYGHSFYDAIVKHTSAGMYRICVLIGTPSEFVIGDLQELFKALICNREVLFNIYNTQNSRLLALLPYYYHYFL